MTWAEVCIQWRFTNRSLHRQMLITSVCNQKRMPAYKSLWGTDPFYTSPDLSPHARFITPQCGRLTQGEGAFGKTLKIFLISQYQNFFG